VFLVAVFFVAILSGATATVVGFGIGSLLTPLLAVHIRHHNAVALVTLPHRRDGRPLLALARHVDRTVLVRSACSAQRARWQAP
jgi:hypothetical protein